MVESRFVYVEIFSHLRSSCQGKLWKWNIFLSIGIPGHAEKRGCKAWGRLGTLKRLLSAVWALVGCLGTALLEGVASRLPHPHPPHLYRGRGNFSRESFSLLWLQVSLQISQPRTWEGRMRSGSLPWISASSGWCQLTALQGQMHPAEAFSGHDLI